MMPLDIWAPVALLALLALLASLRLSFPAATGSAGLGPLRLLMHPVWLLPLLLALPMTVGLMMTGAVPISPVAARAMIAADYGVWAGLAALITVMTAELWLLWVPSMLARRSALPERQEALRFLPLLNLALGSGFLLIVVLASR